MSESRFGSSRRQLLRYCALGSAVGLAGCLWDDNEPPDDGDLPGLFELAGDGAVPFREWLLPDNTIGHDDDTETVFVYRDYELAAERDWEDALLERQQHADTLGSQPESHSALLMTGIPTADEWGLVHLGTFDHDTVVEFQENSGFEITDEYRGFSVLDGQFAVGSEAILGTPAYEQHIDAKGGDAERAEDSDADVRLLLDLLPEGVQITASRNQTRENVPITGTSTQEIGPDGGRHRAIRAIVFDDVEVTSIERAREITEDEEVLTEEQHGRVVMLEYRL